MLIVDGGSYAIDFGAQRLYVADRLTPPPALSQLFQDRSCGYYSTLMYTYEYISVPMYSCTPMYTVTKIQNRSPLINPLASPLRERQQPSAATDAHITCTSIDHHRDCGSRAVNALPITTRLLRERAMLTHGCHQ